jgi:hypothetical protein
LLIAALLLDVTGRVLDSLTLWTAGAHITEIGVSLGVAVACLTLIEGVRRGQLLWLSGLTMFTLARILRGSAAVPPDAPLLVASALGCALTIAASLRQYRTPSQGKGLLTDRSRFV